LLPWFYFVPVAPFFYPGSRRAERIEFNPFIRMLTDRGSQSA